MSTPRKLRLGPLPRTESVKLTFICTAGLKAELDRYAELHAQTYGEAVDAMALVPHMLKAFMVRDRGFHSGGSSSGMTSAKQQPGGRGQERRELDV